MRTNSVDLQSIYGLVTFLFYVAFIGSLGLFYHAWMGMPRLMGVAVMALGLSFTGALLLTYHFNSNAHVRAMR